jgi:hypothetical protein
MSIVETRNFILKRGGSYEKIISIRISFSRSRSCINK